MSYLYYKDRIRGKCLVSHMQRITRQMPFDLPLNKNNRTTHNLSSKHAHSTHLPLSLSAGTTQTLTFISTTNKKKTLEANIPILYDDALGS